MTTTCDKLLMQQWLRWKTSMYNLEWNTAILLNGTSALLSSPFWHWASFHITGGLYTVPLFTWTLQIFFVFWLLALVFCAKVFLAFLVRTLPVLTPICYPDLSIYLNFLDRVPVLVLTPVFGNLFTCFLTKMCTVHLLVLTPVCRNHALLTLIKPFLSDF